MVVLSVGHVTGCLRGTKINWCGGWFRCWMVFPNLMPMEYGGGQEREIHAGLK